MLAALMLVSCCRQSSGHSSVDQLHMQHTRAVNKQYSCRWGSTGSTQAGYLLIGFHRQYTAMSLTDVP
jgi:hypothetical protein